MVTDAAQKTGRHVVFMCIANSIRSQLAEGITRTLVGSKAAVSSCGVRPGRVDPAVTEWLQNYRYEWTGLRSKSWHEIDFETVDILVNLTSENILPKTPAHVQRLVWPIEDPELWKAGVPAIARAIEIRIQTILPEWLS